MHITWIKLAFSLGLGFVTPLAVGAPTGLEMRSGHDAPPASSMVSRDIIDYAAALIEGTYDELKGGDPCAQPGPPSNECLDSSGAKRDVIAQEPGVGLIERDGPEANYRFDLRVPCLQTPTCADLALSHDRSLAERAAVALESRSGDEATAPSSMATRDFIDDAGAFIKGALDSLGGEDGCTPGTDSYECIQAGRVKRGGTVDNTVVRLTERQDPEGGAGFDCTSVHFDLQPR